MSYLVSKIEIFTTSIALTLTVFCTAPERSAALWLGFNFFQNENKIVSNEKYISDLNTITVVKYQDVVLEKLIIIPSIDT